MNSGSTAGPLAGIRVVEFGHYVASPLLGMLLADYGADVVAVDAPVGSRGRRTWGSPVTAVFSRGKRRMELDLRASAGKATANGLIDSADVLIENFRPGAMERLGLGPDSALARNPRLVYCSLPGFASDDPRRGMPAWEGVVAAASATYTPGDSGATDPEMVELPLASNFAAFIGATSVIAALLARERDGLGQWIEVPLFDAMFQAIGRKGMRILSEPRGRDAPDLFGGGNYECSDGRWVHFSTYNPRFLGWLADAAGIEAWPDGPPPTPTALREQPERATLLRERLKELFRSRSSANWDELGERAGVPLALVLGVGEWAKARHSQAAGIVVEVDDPRLGRLRQPGLIAELGRTPGLDPGRGTVAADESGGPSGIVAGSDSWPAGREGKTGSLTGSPPLRGVRVVDVTHVFAGPTAGRTLAELGAEVVKIDNPKVRTVLDHRHLNRGKRTVLLDLMSEDGQRVLRNLLRDADVLIHSFSEGAAERLGLGYERLRERYPSLIYAEISAFGGPGPWRHRRGYEPQAQAVSGIAAPLQPGQEPGRISFALNDYGTGILTAFAIEIALLARERDGRGQLVSTSLARTATLHQAVALAETGNDASVVPSEGGQAPALQGLFRSTDGWFFLGATSAEAGQLAEIEGLEELRGVTYARRELVLQKLVASEPTATWIERLSGAGLGAQACVTVEELMRDPWVVAHGLSITRQHEDVGAVRTIGPSPRLRRTPVHAGDPARSPGADAAAVLAEIGHTADLTALIDGGIVVTKGVGA